MYLMLSSLGERSKVYCNPGGEPCPKEGGEDWQTRQGGNA